MTDADGGPAFPAYHFDLAANEHGMSLRDYFAAAALPCISAFAAAGLHELHGKGYASPEAQVAADAYRLADAMLQARKPK